MHSHLIVQPSVHEVIQIATTSEIRGGQHLPQIIGSRVRSAVLLESVQVIPRMIGYDDDERMDVG
jgi:hypothetical protein